MRRIILTLILAVATPALADGVSPIQRLVTAHDAFMASLPAKLGPQPWALRDPAPGVSRSAQLVAYDDAIASARAWSVRADASDLVPRKGLWIRPYSGDLSDLDILKVMDDAQSLGITDLFVETFWGGKLIFPGNPTFPDRYPGVDLLKAYVREGHRRGIRVHAWLHTLNFGPAWAAAHPDTLVKDGFGDTSGEVEKGSDTVSPALPEVKVELDRIVDELASHSVDGVMLDYLRYPTRMKGDDIDSTPDPRNFFGYNARQLALMEQRHPELDTPAFQNFLETGVPAVESDRQADLDQFKQSLSEDLTGLIDNIKAAIHGRMLLDAAYFPDYYFHENDTRVQESAEWANRFNLLSPMCYEFYLDDYPAPYGTYTIWRALRIADDTVAQLPAAQRPLLMPSFTAEAPGTPMASPYHHQTLRAQVAFLKGLLFDRTFPEVGGVAYFSYGWIFPAFEAVRKATG